MSIVRTIAIIGATGQMGSAIAESLSTSTYRLLLMARQQEQLDQLKLKIETTDTRGERYIFTCAKEAAWEADVIILAVPYEVEKAVAEKIHDVVMSKIVISISNPAHRNYNHPALSSAEELQLRLPHSKVIKAFNTQLAVNFSSPISNGKEADIFIAGSHSEALEIVSEVVRATGFNPVIAGEI